MKTSNYQDDELIAEFHRGNAAAFEQIYKRYHSYIFILAQRYLSVEEDAKDIRSRSFIRLWELRDKLKFDSMAALYSWLRSTTRNSCIDYLRGRSIRDSKISEIAKLYTESNGADVFEASDKEAIILDKLLHHIELLPTKFKQVFRLRWLDDLKFREIAEHLDADVSTIKKRYSRAVELLREKVPLNELVVFLVFILPPGLLVQ
jgi:RNA polymerase sigma-70 factor (ECF subfamily)